VDLIKAEEHEDEEEEEEHGEYDPHVWLNPMNVMKQAENIKNAFVKADEANKDFYEANFNEYADKLKALDEKYKQELSNTKRKEIVVAHGAFGYLANRYGLEQVAITGLSPQEEPSAAKMVEISKFAKEYNLKYIFFETLTSPRLAQVLADEVGASTLVLNPLEGLTQEEINAGKDYIVVMEENLAALKKALGE
jgi:zinc transport system substrate-binding protein